MSSFFSLLLRLTTDIDATMNMILNPRRKNSGEGRSTFAPLEEEGGVSTGSVGVLGKRTV